MIDTTNASLSGAQDFGKLDAQDEISRLAQITPDEAFLQEMASEIRMQASEVEDARIKMNSEKFLDGPLDMQAWAKMASGFRF